MIGTIPAELVWSCSAATAPYDLLLFRAMAAEYNIAVAFVGVLGPGELWYNGRHFTHRWEPFQRAGLLLLKPSVDSVE